MKIKGLLTKQFYRYWFYKIKREKPWDYLFFDWKTFFVLMIVFLAGLFLLFPGKIFINIPEKTTQVYILESILRNLSLFVGTSFSFIILSFNIFYRYFGRYAFLDFFKNNSAKICLTLLTCSIGLLIYSTAYIRDINQINGFDRFLFVFCIILSIISFFSVFPCLLNLLKSSQNRENIKRLFKRLNENWIIDKFYARVIDKSMHGFYHKDPISILNEIGLSSIKEFDNKTILVITASCPDFFETNLKLLEVEESRIDNLTLYDEFTQLLSNLFQLSVKERNETASLMILNSRIKLEELVLNNLKTKGFENFIDHAGLYRHWRLNFDIADYFKRAIQFDEDEVCKRLIDNFRDFIIKSIPILFPKDFKYASEHHYRAAREVDMVFEPMRTIDNLIPIIIAHSKFYLFQPVFNFYFTIEQSILKLDIGNEEKCFILSIIFNYKYDVFDKYSDSPEIQNITFLNFPFNVAAQTYKETDCSTQYLGLLKVMDLLYSKNKLNVMVINSHKAELFHLIDLLKEKPGAKKLIEKSVKKIKEIASRIRDEDSDTKKDTYLKLEKYLRFVFESAQEKRIDDEEILSDLKNSLDSFTYINQFRDELGKKGYIGDERII